ncbi:MAG: helicase C-terminal domain-containing protein [Candidatus Brocadiia bacterium]
MPEPKAASGRQGRPMVFVDLETTGLDEAADEIIEFAAVRPVPGGPPQEFSRLAHPGRPLPLAITRLTGITEADLRGQPPSRAGLAEFIRFVGDDVLVAHNAPFDQAFLRRKSDGYVQNRFIDTLELSRILFPTLEYHDLDTVAEALGLQVSGRHRALEDARLVAALWERLLERLEELPFEVVAALSAVAGGTAWPARHLFLEAEARRLTSAFEVAEPAFHKLLRDQGPLIDEARKQRQRGPADRPPPKRLDVAALTALFAEGGPFARHSPAYELRPQQVRMVELVAEALNEGKHLMVEAGTGVGKSMAYLVPAIHWARTNQDKIVVSTNTKNLQEQLFFKDLPLLAEALDIAFQAALIKGRRNYLCVRKLLYLLEETDRELSEDERIALLPILVWAAETDVGDVAENTGFLAFRQLDLWAKLCAASEECPGPACRQRRRCFLARARALSVLADIVVANHAVVFAEIGMGSTVLPPHSHIVFDEAHNLEDVATDYLGCQADRWAVLRHTHRLVRRQRRAQPRGLLPSIRYRMKRGRETALIEREMSLDRFLVETYAAVDDVEVLADAFLGAVGEALAAARSGDSVRYQAESRDPQVWAAIEETKRNLVAGMGELRRRLERIAQELEALAERDFPYRSESVYDLRGVGEALEALERDLEFLVAGDDPTFVYWLERVGRRRPFPRIAAAPIRIGPKIKEVLYDQKDTIVFTSATLTAAGSFQFLKDRLGLDQVEAERLVEEDVGSPFDYDRQMLICVPSYLPEPDREGGPFLESLAPTMLDIFRASGGRGLGLFTSYAMLNDAYPKLKGALEAERVLVLGQGFDGGRRALTRVFRRETSSVLLGTDSFWEGVDVPGESLSCLVLVKLPFAVHTAPIVQARCEEVESRGLNAFVHYSLPSAIIRFKQGAGRLIRTRSDVGAVVVLDRRVLSRRYGVQFLRSLPTGHRACANPRHLCDMIRAFLAPRRTEGDGR